MVKQLLVDLNMGVLPSYNASGAYVGLPWPVFASGEPDIPDNCITVYDTTGIKDTRNMYGGLVFYHLGFQVRIRAVDHTSGWLKAEEIQDALAKQVLRRQIVVTDGNTYLVQCIAKIGRILDLGKDMGNSKRTLFTLNALVTMKKVSIPTMTRGYVDYLRALLGWPSRV